MRANLVLCLLLASLSAAAAQGQTNRTTSGFDHFYNLEYEEAIADFRVLTSEQPKEPEAFNHLAQAIFYGALFENGLMGSDLLKSNEAVMKSRKLAFSGNREQEFQYAVSQSITLAEARISEDARDAAAKYQLGNAMALRANYEFLVNHAWMVGLRDANRSRKLHEEVMRMQPGNYDARLIPGTHEYMIGTLPAMVRLAARAAGFSGNRRRGMAMIEGVAAHGDSTKMDAQILLGILYRREGRNNEAAAYMRSLSESYPRNFLFHIELAKLYSEMDDRRSAIAELRFIQQRIDERAPGYTGQRVAVIRTQAAEMMGQYAGDQQAHTASGSLAFR